MSEYVSEIVNQELNYIQNTIDQSISDRYQMLSFYITLTGGFSSVIIGLLSFGKVGNSTYIGASIIAFLSGILGMIFWLKFVRLRQAWRESLVAFNRFKSTVISSKDDISEAFLWSHDTIPSLDKIYTIHYYSALIVFVLMMASFLMSLVFALQLGVAGIGLILGLVFSSGVTYSLHFLLYKQIYSN